MTFKPERCFLINLDRRNDRLLEWHAQRPDPWPFPEVERYPAIDGKKIPTPPQWKNGNGAWGCYRSHLNILEKCLMEGVSSYVVFEDDAGFVEDFGKAYLDYVSHLPDDWGLAYLGGQHLSVTGHPPRQINDYVYRPYNVNRTHGFMVRGKAAMRTLYRHLTWNGWSQARHHIDHHLGRLVQRDYVARYYDAKVDKERISTYTPKNWLVGQLPSQSNICGRKWDETRFFNHASDVESTQSSPFYAVMGLHRSGSSCLATVMRLLGVHMGNHLTGYEGTGGGEAKGLASLCEKAMPFPTTEIQLKDEHLVRHFRQWINARRMEAQKLETVCGGKYPHLCAFGEYLLEAAGPESLRIVSIDRDLGKSIDSLNRRSAKNPGKWFACTPAEAEKHQTFLYEQREAFFEKHEDVEVLRIEYERLLHDPLSQIERLIAFLGIYPTEDQIQQAVGHVKPALDHSQQKEIAIP